MNEPPAANTGSGPERADEAMAQEDAANIAARVEGRLDDLARRFDRSDWSELFAAVLLALATTIAAWSAYQSTRWSGNQTIALSEATALRAQANDEMTIAEGGLEVDVEMFSTWVVLVAEGNERGAAAISDRFRDEFRPAFEDWLGDAPFGEIPPGAPFESQMYEQTAGIEAQEANIRFREADEAAAEARDANQTGDDFVLVAVVMATVLFFTGISTKLRGRPIRIAMLLLASVFFILGLGFMLSLPQSFAI